MKPTRRELHRSYCVMELFGITERDPKAQLIAEFLALGRQIAGSGLPLSAEFIRLARTKPFDSSHVGLCLVVDNSDVYAVNMRTIFAGHMAEVYASADFATAAHSCIGKSDFDVEKKSLLQL